MVIQRGDVWWADLGEPRGSTPAYRRPIAIIQADAFNRSAIRTVVGVALTTNLRLLDAPGNVLIPARTAGLPRESVANVSQLATIDRADLIEKAGRLPNELVWAIDRGLRLVLDL